MIRLCLLVVTLLAACAPQPHGHVHLDSRTGQITPSASANLGAVSLGISPHGRTIGTSLGGFGLSAGF